MQSLVKVIAKKMSESQWRKIRCPLNQKEKQINKNNIYIVHILYIYIYNIYMYIYTIFTKVIENITTSTIALTWPQVKDRDCDTVGFKKSY